MSGRDYYGPSRGSGGGRRDDDRGRDRRDDRRRYEDERGGTGYYGGGGGGSYDDSRYSRGRSPSRRDDRGGGSRSYSSSSRGYSNGGSSYGNGGSSYGNGGSSYGNGGSSYGNGGSSYGNGGSSYGNGGSSYGNGGSSYGNGGNSYGNGSSYGNGGSSYGNGGSSYGNGGGGGSSYYGRARSADGDRYRGGNGNGNGRYGGGGGNRGGGGGGRGGRGGGRAEPFASDVDECTSNILGLEVDSTFHFFVYTIAFQDAKTPNGNGGDTHPRYESSRSRNLKKRLWLGALKDLGVTDLYSKICFFEGTQAFSYYAIPGLEPDQLPKTLSTNKDNLKMVVTDAKHMSVPEELLTKNVDPQEPLSEKYADHSQPSSRSEFLMFVSLALKYHMTSHPKLQVWGRHFIDRAGPLHSQRDDVDVYRAFSIKPMPIKTDDDKFELGFVCDVRAKILRKTTVLELAFEKCRRNGSSHHDFDSREKVMLREAFQGEPVVSITDKRTYVIDDMVFDESPDERVVPNLQMSHTDYFKNRKKIALKYPALRIMIKCLSRGSSIYLPPELVTLENLEERSRRDLPRIAAFNPQQRSKGHEDMKTFLTTTAADNLNIISRLGISYKEEGFKKVGVRLLRTPTFLIGRGDSPSDAGNLRRRMNAPVQYNAARGEKVPIHVVLVVHRDLMRDDVVRQVYERKVADLINAMGSKFQLGRTPGHDMTVIEHNGSPDDHFGKVNDWSKHVTSGDVNMNGDKKIYFVIDFHKPPVARRQREVEYLAIKKELGAVGCLSQFVNFTNNAHHRPGTRASYSIFQNVNRQILAKCGLNIWRVSIPPELPLPAMFVGLDVCHSPRRMRDRKFERKDSVAACVALIVTSHESDDCIDRVVSCQVQTQDKAGTEVNLEKLIENTIAGAVSGREPGSDPLRSCIMWRDGVGDTTVQSTADLESSAIRKAFEDMSISCPLAYVVCQKDISTKFLAMKDSKPYGLKEGMLVENLNHPDFAQTFYIHGNCPPNSTPKSVRFIVGDKDSELSNVRLEELSWNMCFDYPNWTGPIQLPAPTKMAHKLADVAANLDDLGESLNFKAFQNTLFFL